MTQIAPSQTVPTTPLALLLASSAERPALAAYRGVVTLQQFDAPEKEIAALLSGASAHDLGWLSRVAVRGEDRFRWLSGMVTNMVKDLAVNAGAWNLVLNAQGRIQGDLTVWRDGEQLELEFAADQRETLLAHLDRFIIMDDVELVPLEGQTAIGLAGPQAAEVLARIGMPAPSEPMTSAKAEWNGLNVEVVREYGALAPHYVLWVPASGLQRLWRTLTTAGAARVGSTALEAFRIAEGIPAYGIDMVERDLPQETSQMRALHFNKGCYLGQEIVERIRSRGSVHRHLRQLELFGPLPVPGAELKLEDGSPAGHITSAARLGDRIFALGMIRGEAELRNQAFNYHDEESAGTARILPGPPAVGPAES